MMNLNDEMVNHPKHYVSESGVECINVIRYLPYALATACKYVWRYRSKWDPIEDLEKANFFLEDYQNHLFLSKKTDDLFHQQTVGAAKLIMQTKIRDDFRTHILYLQNKDYGEATFFDALYTYIQKAQHGVVSYDLFADVMAALTALRAKVATEFPSEDLELLTESK